MNSKSDSGTPRQGRIGRGAKLAFLGALRAGASRDEAARQAGFTQQGFYYARRRDPLFKLGWIWALALSAADERMSGGAPSEAVEITPNNRRRLQRRKVRSPRFSPKRKKIFLSHFIGTADLVAAAEAAGVHHSTVYNHLHADPEFARDFAEALQVAYAALEAEAVRQRIEAQRAVRDGLCPKGELPQEFDRVMRLLARYGRKDGRIGLRSVGPGRERRWSFDEAIALLDKKLRALGISYPEVRPDDPRLLPPPPGDGHS